MDGCSVAVASGVIALRDETSNQRSKTLKSALIPLWSTGQPFLVVLHQRRIDPSLQVVAVSMAHFLETKFLEMVNRVRGVSGAKVSLKLANNL